MWNGGWETYSERCGDSYAGLGGHPWYQEAQEVISLGSWRLCTPPSSIRVQTKVSKMHYSQGF